jgi:mRNA interferase MazF
MKNIIPKYSPKRGEIYLINFEPAIGREIRKTRPAVIVQNNLGNQVTSFVIVCPLTTQLPPKEAINLVAVNPPEANIKKKSVIICNLIYTFDQKRLIEKIGEISASTLIKVDLGLAAVLDI